MKLSADQLTSCLITSRLSSPQEPTSPAASLQKHKLHVDKDFNLVPAGGGMISYNKASNHRAGQHTWNVIDLKISAQLANDAYENNNNHKTIHGKMLNPLTEELKPSGLEEENGIFHHKHTDGQVMAWSSQDTVYLAFRGTSNLHDVKQDMLLPLSKRSHDAFNTLVLKAANLANNEGKHLVITGHSLGANHVNEFATKAAQEDKFAALRNASFIGFASPGFSHHANVLNVGMNNDPVFGILSTSTHRYSPGFLDQPQYVAGLKYGGDTGKHIKNPHAHSMVNIQQSVDLLTRFDRLDTTI